jgi:hydroxybutyrate-dimer hydrolase
MAAVAPCGIMGNRHQRTRCMRCLAVLAIVVLSACSGIPTRMGTPGFLLTEVRVTRHEGADDLLTGGLGLAGLRAPVPPAPADPAAPTAGELRRRALHANWRGIADLADPAYPELAPVPGREFSALARVPGARQPHRVLAQVPDAFDAGKRCLVVAAASGSRGVYGAIGALGSWALPRGCALVHTDKGNGTGFFDFDSDTGATLDGTRAARGTAILEFEPAADEGVPHGVALKHAHSRDNPESDWSRHVLQAAGFGLHALDLAFPAQAPFTPDNTRIIAAGISNGGGAVLRAGERPEAVAWFDAVVAGEPNVTAPGARPLFDYATEAALYQPCLLLALPDAPQLMPDAAWRPASLARCASLQHAGLVGGEGPVAQAQDALARLRAGGWTDGALGLASVNAAFDLWRAITATYVQAYARATPAEQVCGYGFAAQGPDTRARETAPGERALWWSDATGIAPTAGVGIIDTLAEGATDPYMPGSWCARRAWTGDDALARRVRSGVEATRASADPRAPITLIVHGQDDGLVPIAFTSRPYAQLARDTPGFRFWEVPRAQHFDAFLAVPAMRARHVALIPHLHRALDHAWTAIAEGREPPESGVEGVPL